MNSADDQEERQWRQLYRNIRQRLARFGHEDASRRADFWVDDSDVGHRQQKVYINSLELLRPQVIKSLQGLLEDFAGWEIVVAVSIPTRGEGWPTMGLTIRGHEIIDGLQRQYFPEEFRSIFYDGSRPGTERD